MGVMSASMAAADTLAEVPSTFRDLGRSIDIQEHFQHNKQLRQYMRAIAFARKAIFRELMYWEVHAQSIDPNIV